MRSFFVMPVSEREGEAGISKTKSQKERKKGRRGEIKKAHTAEKAKPGSPETC